MTLRLSRFVHLLPVGEDRVLVLHAVNQLRLVVDGELGELIGLFQSENAIAVLDDINQLEAALPQ